MMDELVKLTGLFCEHGGRFENATVGYREEIGYYCAATDSRRNATIFCPAHLLVDINDIGISEAGLFIAKPENYPDSMQFLENYFSFHFNAEVVGKLLEEKNQIDSLSEQEKLLLKKIQLPAVIQDMDDKLEYARWRILNAHKIGSGTLGDNDKRVVMPFISFLNYDRDGIPFEFGKNGVTVSGKFDGEIFALYHLGDVLTLLKDYGFVTDTMLVYSLPMWLKLPDGMTVKINRNVSEFQRHDSGLKWPVVRKQEDCFTVSWFPMYLEKVPAYPARFAAYLAREVNHPAEDILYAVFQHNLNQLLPIAFDLNDSRNAYVQTAISGVKRQLELIGRIHF